MNGSPLPSRKLARAGAIFTGIGVAILLGLGTWQIQRLHWKDAIVEKLEAAYSSGNEPIEAAALAAAGANDYLYGKLQGRLQRDKAILLGPRTDNGRAGYELLVPLTLDNGRSLIVNAGWVSVLWQDDIEERLAALPQEQVTMRGLARMPDWSRFASKNSPSRDLWFRADIAEIAAAKNIEAVYSGIVLYADRTDPPLHDVKPHEAHWLPRNKHLQYAIFWYAMAATLAGVYLFAILGKKRLPAA